MKSILKNKIFIFVAFSILILLLSIPVFKQMEKKWQADLSGAEKKNEMALEELEKIKNNYGETQEELLAQKEELQGQQEIHKLTQAQIQQLEEQISAYQENSENIDKEAYLKEKMLMCYLENQELLIAAQAEILEGFGVESDFLISYEERDVGGEALDLVQSTVLDGLAGEFGMAGELVGDTISSSIDALKGEVSIDSLYTGITEGIANGMQNVLKGMVEEKISGLIGLDVFSAADLLGEILSCQDAMPEYLASQISSQIQRDADYLRCYLSQDVLKKEDLENITTYYDDFSALADELYLQTNEEVDVRMQMGALHLHNLQTIYKKYCANEAIIRMCSERAGVESGNE